MKKKETNKEKAGEGRTPDELSPRVQLGEGQKDSSGENGPGEKGRLAQAGGIEKGFTKEKKVHLGEEKRTLALGNVVARLREGKEARNSLN